MRAKVGDKIRIVDEMYASATYGNGDVFTVTYSRDKFVVVAEHEVIVWHGEYEIINEGGGQ